MGREEWVTVALEEYKTLRQESLAAIEQMQRTLQIGLVAIGVLTAFAAEAVGEGAGVQVGLALAAPLLAALVAALRLDELHRAVAAGAHIAVLEQQIARRVGDDEPPLTWESNIQKTFKRRKDKLRHWATLLALFAAAAPTAVLGISDYGERHGPEWVGVAAAVVLIFSAIAWYQRYTLNAVADLHEAALEEITAPQRSAGNSGGSPSPVPVIASAISRPERKPGTFPWPEYPPATHRPGRPGTSPT
jgi:hypothetical protein